MTEYNLGYLAIGNLALLVLACLFYMLGGRNNKALRRFIAPLFITIGINVTALLLGHYKFLLLAVYPLVVTMFCLGYGGDDLTGRLIKRALVALFSVMIGGFLCWIFLGGWWLLLIHLLVAITTVMFAWKNALPAAVEEPLVCLLLNVMIVLYPFIVGF